jgi:hypothetical protein
MRILSAWFVVLTLTLGCAASGTGSPVRMPDGSYSLSCKGPLSDCLRHAARLCRDQGYTVRDARDVRQMLGHEAGQSQVLVERSEATVYCGASAPHPPPVRLVREPEAPQESGKPPEAAAPVASAPPRACVPGATQSCVGPGGCPGGQSCAADGSRFEVCDCGSPKAPPAP